MPSLVDWSPEESTFAAGIIRPAAGFDRTGNSGPGFASIAALATNFWSAVCAGTVDEGRASPTGLKKTAQTIAIPVPDRSTRAAAAPPKIQTSCLEPDFGAGDADFRRGFNSFACRFGPRTGSSALLQSPRYLAEDRLAGISGGQCPTGPFSQPSTGGSRPDSRLGCRWRPP